jgi:hypothetical protein
MMKKFYLPGLLSISPRDFKGKIDADKKAEFDKIIKEKAHTFRLYEFLYQTNHFYRKNFNTLEKCKIREKRLLAFETPNRCKITHEYDIIVYEKDKDVYNNYNYLFNPINRLNWLKIKQNGKRILIAPNDVIKKMVKSKLEYDLKSFISSSKEQDLFFEYIWDLQISYPCFIKIEDISRENFLIEAEYYDSTEETDKNTKKCYIFAEREISYKYYPLRNFTSWLYVQAPKDFNLKIECLNDEEKINIVEYDKNNKNSDPDIKTLIIKNLKEADEESYNVEIKIKIEIPESLKCWFNSIFWLSCTVASLLFIHLVNHIFLIPHFNFSHWDPIGKIMSNGNFHKVILAIVAGIVTTRGWLISEETILRRYSKGLTFITLVLIIMSILLCLIG